MIPEIFHSRISINKLLENILVFLIFIYPYFFILTVAFPFSYSFGKSIIVLSITLFFLLLFIKYLFSRNLIYKPYLIITLLFAFSIIFVRNIIYDENILTQIFNHRSAILLIVYMVVIYKIVNSRNNSARLLLNIILFNAVIQALVGVIHHYYFGNIVTGAEFLPEGEWYAITSQDVGTRESGLLLSSNAYANFLILGLFILYYKDKYLKIGFSKNITIDYIILILLVWGIILSGSRFAVIAAILLLTVYVFNFRKFSIFKGLLVAVFIILIAYYCMNILGQIFERLQVEGAYARALKNNLAIDLLIDKFLYIIFGVPDFLIATTQTKEGLFFSDNSFLSVTLQYGMFFAIFWFYIVFMFFKHTSTIRMGKFLLLYFISILWITNAILWDVWVVYFISTYYALDRILNQMRDIGKLNESTAR